MKDDTTFTVGTELHNDAKNMSLGVIVDVTTDTVVTEDVAGSRRTRTRENVETLLETSSLEEREPPEWFN